MTRTRIIFALVAAAALAGCNEADHTIVAGGPADPMANQLANAAPVELPPSIAASEIYRCKDNSLVYIDWLRDSSGEPAGANFRADRNAAPTQLKPGAEGEAFVAEGYSLTGTAVSETITLTRPSAASQTCKG